MKALVLYYSRTGTTAKVAEAEAKGLGADLAEITCSNYGRGFFSYFIAGYHSVKGRLPEIKVSPKALEEYDLVVLGAPVWTSYPALPLRSYLSQNPKLPGRVAVFLTLAGESKPQKAFDMLTELLPAAPEAMASFLQVDVHNDIAKDAIEGFVSGLKSHPN